MPKSTGTGHHLLKGIVSESPALDRLRHLGIHYPLTTRLQDSLHKEGKKTGLFNVHCHPDASRVNLTSIQQDVVTVMSEIRQVAENNSQVPNKSIRHADDIGYQNIPQVVAIPVNTLQTGSTGSGEMSYPNFHGPCRKLNYPSLHLFYEACRAARVDCQHVYIYRNPYSILRSTTDKRGFNDQNNRLEAVHMYTSLLHIIYAQMTIYADRTIGCYGMLDDGEGDWWNNVRAIFGWKNQTAFDQRTRPQFFKAHKHVPLTDQQKLEIVPAPLQIYMDAWMTAHEQVIQLCQQSQQQNAAKVETA